MAERVLVAMATLFLVAAFAVTWADQSADAVRWVLP